MKKVTLVLFFIVAGLAIAVTVLVLWPAGRVPDNSRNQYVRQVSELCNETGGSYYECPPCPRDAVCSPCPPACTCLAGTSWVDNKGCTQSDQDVAIQYKAICELTGGTHIGCFPCKPGTVCEKCISCSCPVGSEWDYELGCVSLQTYRNNEYGFTLEFPESWKGYSVTEEQWQGQTLNEESASHQGPRFVFRHPVWNESTPRQDIPIMIFTPSQWRLVEDQNLNVSAAPIGPSKLGQNDRFVFALPPRWVGFTDALGQDEAQEIVKTFNVIGKNSDIPISE